MTFQSMTFNPKQKISITLTIMLLMLISLSHLVINREIQESRKLSYNYQQLASAYQQGGIEGLKVKQKELFPSDYRSSDIFFAQMEEKLKDMPVGVFNSAIEKNRDIIYNLREKQFKINIVLMAIFIIGLGLTYILGIKNRN